MLNSGRYFFRQVSFSIVNNSLPAVRQCTTAVSQPESNVAASPGDIVIPPRIERGPTDILKALASTVEADFKGSDYKYQDDPYFCPLSVTELKASALALESGRKSAKWIFENNPGFFKHQISDPPIKAFLPTEVENAESELTEESLISEIKRRNVLKAVEVFKALNQKDIEVSECTKQCLLELVCFYNCEENVPEELEKKWFTFGNLEEPETCTWKHKHFAQELYATMDPTCPLAKAAIIQGMFKYNEIYNACKLFEEARVQKMKLPVSSYNAYLSKIHTLGVTMPKLIVETLRDMSKKKVVPNLNTLNAVLETLFKSKGFPGKTKVALLIIKEFEKLGIQLSLGSYGLLFGIISSSPKSMASESDQLLQGIMNTIENQKHEILHPSDLNFFCRSMNAFSEKNSDLALQLNDMLWKNSNIKFLTSFTHCQSYFNRFFFFLFTKKSSEFAMENFKKYCMLYSLISVKTLKVIIKAVKESKNPLHLSFIWDYLKKKKNTKRPPILRLVITLVNFFSDEGSVNILHEAACAFMEKTKPQELIYEYCDAVSALLTVFVKKDDSEGILKVIQAFENNLELMNLENTEIKTIFDYGVSKKNDFIIKNFLQLAFDSNHPEANEMMKEASPFLNDPEVILTKKSQSKLKEWKKKSAPLI